MAVEGLPELMQAMVLTELGSTAAITPARLAVPHPAADEVLIRVATVAVNRQDINMILGRFANPDLRLPHVLGLDPAGVIAAAGAGAEGWSAGERVVVKPPVACGACEACLAGEDDACDGMRFVGIHRPGGMAEYVAVPAGNVFRIPEGVSFVEATAIAHSFPVALTLLRRVAVGAGDSVLVSGASGALGSAVTQLARLAGARVFALVGSPEGAAWLQQLPRSVAPHAVFDMRADAAFSSHVRELQPGGVSVHVETTADPAVWAESLRSLARRGRVAVVGAHAGPVVDLDLNWLFRQRITIVGCSGSTRAAFEETLVMAGQRRIVPNIDSVLPAAAAPQAYARLQQRQNHGKVVLRLSQDLD